MDKKKKKYDTVNKREIGHVKTKDEMQMGTEDSSV